MCLEALLREQKAARMLPLLGLLIAAGCVPLVLQPPPEAVLAGKWEVVQGADPSLSSTFWTFDDFGNLVEMETKIGAVTVTQRALVSSTDVNGDNVLVQLGFESNNMNFRGTLNEERTRAEGTISVVMSWGPTTVTIDGGAATLVKQ